MVAEIISPRICLTGGLYLLSLAIVLSPENHQANGQISSNTDTALNDHLTKLLIQRLIGDNIDGQTADRRSEDGASIILPQVKREESPIKRYLDEAKEQIEVLDFQKHSRYNLPTQKRLQIPFDEEDLLFGDTFAEEASKAGSEQVSVTLAYPGNEFSRDSREVNKNSCSNCIGDDGPQKSRWSMPLQKLGEKQYYLGIFFKANWYKAEQYCRYHGMTLASINTVDEQRNLEEYIQSYGLGHEHFWTSGTDQGEEGKYFWLSTGRPVTFTNWNAGEPNNFQYEDGEQEHCLEMWDRDGKGMGWNDTPCSFETFFVCEV